jgi:hypothetical protein
MVAIGGIEQIRYGLFVPNERETPIVEVLWDGSVIIDFSFRDDDPKAETCVLFHGSIDGLMFGADLLRAIVSDGIERLRWEVASPEAEVNS